MFASKQIVLLMVSKTLIDKKGKTNVVMYFHSFLKFF